MIMRDSGNTSLTPTGMDERTEKPKGWVGQRGGECSILFVPFLGQAPIGLFRSTYPVQTLPPPPAPWASATNHRCTRFVSDIFQSTTFEQHR